MNRRLGLYRMLILLVMFITLFMEKRFAKAAQSDTINVTIPTSISILFNEEGTNSISEFEVDNQSLVPITIHSIHVTECNDWKLVPKGSKITANTKQLSFEVENQCLQSGINDFNIEILEETRKTFAIQVERGAWSNSSRSSKALDLVFEYSLGTKEFQLTFDTRGSEHAIEPMIAYNGETVILPELERFGYDLLGWQDSEGTLHDKVYCMPIGDVTLSAKWAKTEAYAIYLAEDNSLRFVRSVEPIVEGDLYQEKVVTSVYAGIENTAYAKYSDAPWYKISKKIKNVVVADEIAPVNTDYWFVGLENCESLELSKLNTEDVVSMNLMFSLVGYAAESVSFSGLEKWDVSNVTDMTSMFNGVGFGCIGTVSIGDLSNWNLSNVESTKNMFSSVAKFASVFELYGLEEWDTCCVTNMYSMFSDAGLYSDWALDCSDWNTDNVIRYDLFNYVSETGFTTKVIPPTWVN